LETHPQGQAAASVSSDAQDLEQHAASAGHAKSEGRVRGLWTLGLALLAFAVRSPGLFAGFVFDDAFGMQQRTHTEWSRLLAVFASDQSSFFGSNFYRPVLSVCYEVVYSLAGSDAWAWHLASILLHVAATLLVFRLALVVLEDPFAAGVAAALFAVHPAHVEAISWASALADPLLTVFMLLSVLGFLRWMEQGRVVWWILSLLAGTACIFTKETAVVLPVVLFATALALRPRAKFGLPIVAATLPFFAVALGFLRLRQSVLHSFSHPITVATTAQVIYTWPAALLFYLRHMFWPGVVVPFYPLQIVQSWKSSEFFVPLLGLVCVSAVLGYLLWLSAGWRKACLCAAWMLVPLAPALYLKALAPFELVHDRFLYAPLVGFCLAAALVLQWAAERIEAKTQFRVFALVAFALIPVLGIESMTQMVWWQNNKTLFTRAVAITPENPKALANLAGAYMAERRVQEAAPLLQRALAIAPQDSIVLYGMSRLTWLRGEDAASEQYIIQALRITNRYDMWLQLAAVELRLNKLDVAQAAALQAMAMNSSGADVHAAVGTILLARGDRAAAVGEFQQELRNYPNSESARAGLAQAAAQQPR
jgi:protein O-mannosyl-transferase